MFESLGFVEWKQPSQTVSWLEHEKTPSLLLMLRLTRADSRLQTSHSTHWTKHYAGSKMENTHNWREKQNFFFSWQRDKACLENVSLLRQWQKNFFCAAVDFKVVNYHSKKWNRCRHTCFILWFLSVTQYVNVTANSQPATVAKKENMWTSLSKEMWHFWHEDLYPAPSVNVLASFGSSTSIVASKYTVKNILK